MRGSVPFETYFCLRSLLRLRYLAQNAQKPKSLLVEFSVKV